MASAANATGKQEAEPFQPTNEDYTVGWICALTTEYIAAQVFLDEKHAPPAYIAIHDNNDYTLGCIGKHNVVIAVLPGGEYGTASAAGVARDMLHSFPNIRIGLMVGIGGGAPTPEHDIRLGDVVVSEPQNGLGGVLQYDFGKTVQDQPFQPTRFLAAPPTVLLAAISGLRAKYKIDGHSIQQDVQARLAANKRLRKEFGRPGAETDRLYQSHIVHPPSKISCLSSCGSSVLSVLERTVRDEDDDDPAIHYGLVASANQLMKNAILRDQYANEKGILCFEMEAGGLMNHFPCLVIRGICDYSDTHKNKDWQGYAAMTAAAYAKDLLKRILPTKVEAEKTVSETVENVNQTLNRLRVTGGETFAMMTEMQDSMNQRETKLDMDKLPYARGATFNSKDQDHTTCHPNTRVDLLRQIKDWIRSSSSKSIFWLHGSAGTGKSTISWTIAELLANGSIHKGVDLGASFFFRRGEGDRGSASLFFPTIVRQLVLKIPGLDSFIADAITSDPIICVKALGEQFEKLLYQPLRKISSGPRDRLILVLVVDALDECDKADDIETILELWTRISDISTIRLKLFLTSRPELPIRLRFRSIPATVYQKMSVDICQDILLYDAVPQTTIQQDISMYLESAFSKFRSEYNNNPLLGTLLDHGWPGENVLAILVNKAVPLFIVAATLYRFVSDDNYDPREQLETILNFLETGQLEQMEQTYLPVLNQLAAKLRKSHNRKKLYEECRMVIGSIVTLVEPLSRKSLAVLLQSPPDIVKLRLDPLHSVLRIPDELDMPIRTLHLSFAEFLLSNKSQHELKVDGPTAHQLLLTKSLQLLSRTDGVKPEGLHENLCSLRCPGQLRREVEQSIINQRLSPAVQYACRYWVHHAQQSQVGIHDGCQVHIFLKKHFLHWLEAMSFLNRIADVIAYVNVLRSLVPPQGSNELRAFLDDARRFTLTHRYIADLAPLQLYSSALVFTPQCSIIRRDYGNVPGRLPELPITSITWGPELQKLEGHTDSVNAVAFSQDGSLLASASVDQTVRLWSPSTGQELQKLEGHTDSVKAVAFSQDGSLLASASYDKTVRLWSPSTSQELQKLEGHTHVVNAVAFSQDGSLLASASYDNTIRLWSPSTGQELQKLEGHTVRVNAVAFSQDGSLLASASDDQTVRLWSPSTGQELQKLEGHTSMVNAVAFSQDGSLLASASVDHTVRLWSPSTGQELQKLEGHTLRVNAVAFSQDGSLLASASYDNTVRLWSPSTGQELQKLEGHTHAVHAVAFSQDGSLLASASDDQTVRLWSPSTGQDLQKLEGHTYAVNAVAFSQDGSLLASTSWDQTVRLWSPSTGQELQKLEGHTDSVNAVAFSQDGSLLASASYDKTVRLWSPSTGQELQKLEGHTSAVNAVAFSQDGSLLASASYDKTVRLWSPSTGQELQKLEGHTDRVNAVAFSQDGSLLASASDDQTVRLWSPSTGQELQKLEGHTSRVHAVAFSQDGSLLASASYDKTVRLWSPSTGQEVQKFVGINGKTTIGFEIDERALVTNKGTLPIDYRLLPGRAVKVPAGKKIVIKGEWIEEEGKNLFWFPQEYRVGCSDIHGNTVAIGLRSGKVTIIRLNSQCIV